MRNDQLHNRFAQIVPANVQSTSAVIAGAGMTGSWTALALARMIGRVDIWDFDNIEAENVGVQAYTELDIGDNKARTVARLGFGLPIHAHAERFEDCNHAVPHPTFVIACVDSIPARQLVAQWAYDATAHYFIDTRVLGEIAHIQVVAHGDELGYIQALPNEDEITHARCGAKGTAYAGMWVASQVCALVNRIGKGLPLPKPLTWHVGMNEQIS